jgi:hypothetical protein
VFQSSTFDPAYVAKIVEHVPRESSYTFELPGYTAAREIHRLEASDRHVPILALTAEALRVERERCMAAGMDGLSLGAVPRGGGRDAAPALCAHSS